MNRRDFTKKIVLTTLSIPFIQCTSNEKQKPNIIMIFADDLGWTDLSSFGSDLYETPNIDSMAKDGIKFTDAYAACAVCSPSRAAMLTGKYPARLHITDYIPGCNFPYSKLANPNWTKYLPLEEVTMSEVLKLEGYATAHIGKWHLGNKPYFPEIQGFDLNIGGGERGGPPSYFYPHYKNLPGLSEGEPNEYLTDREAIEACCFMEKNKNQPFFIYLPFHAVHTPIQAKKDLIDKYKTKIKSGMRHTNPLYAAMVHSLDEAVGTILHKIEKLNIAERTIILFTSDNGGAVKEYNRNKPKRTDNYPLRMWKGTPYEGGIRVPFIAYCSSWKENRGTVCNEPVTTVDFYPTILELAEVSKEKINKPGLDGVSLVPLLNDPDAALQREAIYWHYPHYHTKGATPYSIIRKGKYKLLEFFADGALELYDLENDISESNNLADEMPGKVSELHKLLIKWRKDVGVQIPKPNPDFDPLRATVNDHANCLELMHTGH